MQQVAIITGGASGIGAALGTALVATGWHVVLADLNGTGARERAEALTGRGPGTAHGVDLDVRDGSAVTETVRGVHADRGRLDLMVNNASVSIRGEPDELLAEHWQHAIDVDLRGVIHGCHACYPGMKAQRHGTILNVSSLSGLVPEYGLTAPYATAKWGVVGLSLALRAAGAEHGVRVSVLCPGAIDTPMLDGPWPDGLPIPSSVARGPTPRQLLAAAGAPLYPPDRLAEDTLRGLARNRPILIIPRRWYPVWLAWRIAPTAMTAYAARMTAASRHTLREDRARADPLGHGPRSGDYRGPGMGGLHPGADVGARGVRRPRGDERGRALRGAGVS
jgi:NAD(P)-dependent dehydrogenase (short-subunit alcohol dehydrogenase family)